jgi:hypothetical protein
MLKTFAAGLLATALIAGPALAQTSNSTAAPGSAPVATAPAKTMTAPATNAKQAALPSKTVKHAKLHKKNVRHVASRFHVKSSKTHQARHVKPVKSHQAGASTKTGTIAKRS